MKILVTGSEGCIGSCLVAYLESMGHDVLCVDIVQKYRNNYILSNILNLSDAEDKIIEFNPTVIYHLAAMVSRITCEKSKNTTIQTNVIGTHNIIQLSKLLSAKLINFSTSEVYGNQNINMEENIELKPNNMYGISKFMAEQLVKYESESNGLKFINVRPFMIYDENEMMGTNRSMMIRLAEYIVKDIPITIHKESCRTWLHISDAVILFEKLLYVHGNITINIGNTDSILTENLAKLMCEYAGKPNTPITYTKLPSKMTLKKTASFDLQKKLLSHIPEVSLEQGIKLVLDKVKKRISYY